MSTGTVPPMFMQQPGPGIRPMPLRRGNRNTKHLSRLLKGHPYEVTQLGQLGPLRVVFGQPVDQLVHGQDFIVLRETRDLNLLKINPHLTAPAADSLLSPGGIDQNVAHGLRCRGEKVGASGKLARGISAQPQPDLVDQGGGLERVPRGLPRHLMGRKIAQLPVDLCEELAGTFRPAKLIRFRHDWIPPSKETMPTRENGLKEIGTPRSGLTWNL